MTYMGLRPGHCYSDRDRAYTRYAITVPDRNYIGAVPGLKTRQFNSGNSEKPFQAIVDLIADEHGLLRDNALESVRTMINRGLLKVCGKEGFFVKVRVYPFHILRENKQAQGAHADRIQTGMSQAFGKPIGRAARVKKGKVILSVLCDPDKALAVKKILLASKARISFDLRSVVGTNVESLGSKPRPRKLKMIEEEEAKKAQEAAAAAAPAAETKAKEGTAGKEAAPAAEKKEAKPASKEEKKK
ncbi:MAG: 50S ribosomal protein L16 [Candidatus Diapherotrites archaeon]|nr:50S ribosomal protein L16 [Candidatus Diapherotrites archaeon]